MLLSNNPVFGELSDLIPFYLLVSVPTSLAGLGSSYSGNLIYSYRNGNLLSASDDLTDLLTFRFNGGALEFNDGGAWSPFTEIDLSSFLDSQFGTLLTISSLGNLTFLGFDLSSTPLLIGSGENGYLVSSDSPTISKSASSLQGIVPFFALPESGYSYGSVRYPFSTPMIPRLREWITTPSLFLYSDGWLTSTYRNIFSNPVEAVNGYWMVTYPCGTCSGSLRCLRDDLVPFGGTDPYSCQNSLTYRQGPVGLPGNEGIQGVAGPPGPVGERGLRGSEGIAVPKEKWGDSITMAITIAVFAFVMIAVWFIVDRILKLKI